jgi:SHS2 domain-containing protein
VFRWIDHTAELELAVETSSEVDVFIESLAALGQLLGEDPGGEEASHELAVRAADRATLLVEWLSELVFLAETERFVPERVEHIALAPDGLSATVAGRRGNPPHLVKAVTYHRLDFRHDGQLWRATVVLDV